MRSFIVYVRQFVIREDVQVKRMAPVRDNDYTQYSNLQTRNGEPFRRVGSCQKESRRNFV